MVELVEFNIGDLAMRGQWLGRVRVDCRWIVEHGTSGYLVTSPDAPGFVCGADSADHVVAKVPKLLRAFLGDETVEPVYSFFTGPVST